MKEIVNFEKINEIIAKVREMYKYDNRVNKLVLKKAKVELLEDINGNLDLMSIDFSDFDILSIYNNRIVFFPDSGGSETLLKYKNWDELLSL